jgi:hypothetical protein
MGILSSLGNLFGGGDPGKAADIYKQYADKAMGELRGHEGQGRQDIQDYLAQALGYQEPYRQAGQEALGEYQGSLGMPGGVQDRFKASPGYQFALQQGLQATRTGATARGLVGSGAEAKELQRVGQGLANQEYGQYQNRLSNLAGLGQQAASQSAQQAYGAGSGLANLGYGYGGQLANQYTGLGQTMAESELAKQQQRADLLKGIGSWIGKGVDTLGSVVSGGMSGGMGGAGGAG